MEEKLKQYFQTLSKEDKQAVINDLVNQLTNEAALPSTSELKNELIDSTGLTCPHCDSTTIIGFGGFKDTKRYKCKSCSRTFNALTGSAFHKIHKKDMLHQYLYLMLQGYSLRAIVKEMDICLKTTFDWRHKILKSLQPGTNQKLQGIIEADETFFLHSEKGNKKLKGRKPRKRGNTASKRGINKDHITVLTAFERETTNIYNSVVCRGRITKKAIHKGVGQHIDRNNSILCSDSHLSFQAYTKDRKIDHKCIFVRRKEFVVDKIYHIQNVNKTHQQLKRWISKFNGVSTKYLQNYLNYFKLVYACQNKEQQTRIAIQAILAANKVFTPRNKISQQHCIT